MKKWTVEMHYGMCVTLEGIKATSATEAIDKAKEMFDKDKSKYADVDELEFDYTTFIHEE